MVRVGTILDMDSDSFLNNGSNFGFSFDSKPILLISKPDLIRGFEFSKDLDPIPDQTQLEDHNLVVPKLVLNFFSFFIFIF